MKQKNMSRGFKRDISIGQFWVVDKTAFLAGLSVCSRRRRRYFCALLRVCVASFLFARA